ncbi:MAG TPA: hypothetical protein VM324_09690 [Egibacteraceae bacterium]|nr:hypothetical protein [Egibacteraceae bacterium]
MRRPPAVQRYRDAFVQRDLVQELEALIHRANPPLTTLDVDGWQLRSARGLSPTANSVWPRATRGRLPLAARVEQVERFYANRRLAPRFLVSPSADPGNLDLVLAGAGYTATAPVEVRTARVERLADVDAAARGVTLSTAPAPSWLHAWARLAGQAEEVLDTAGALLGGVAAEQAFAHLHDVGAVVAVARGVCYGGWLGVDYLSTAPAWRTAATGRALLGALARWAAGHEAEQAYCAVDTADPAARQLIDGAGWRRAYSYRFRVHPLPPARG